MDHTPRHVHGLYAQLEVIVDLNPDGTVSIAKRKDAVRPANGSKPDIRHVLTTAAGHFEALVALWEKQHNG